MSNLEKLFLFICIITSILAVLMVWFVSDINIDINEVSEMLSAEVTLSVSEESDESLDIIIDSEEEKEESSNDFSSISEETYVEYSTTSLDENSQEEISFLHSSISEESVEESAEEFSEEFSDISLKQIQCGDTLLIYVYDEDKSISDSFRVHLYNKNSDRPNREDADIFFSDILAFCRQINHEGIPLPALLAQAYTEGGGGKAGVYRSSNNLFGIRAGGNWDRLVYSRDLKRVFDSYTAAKKFKATDLFRAYASIEDSIKDYVELIQNSPLYKKALYQSNKTYLRYLVKGGYGSSYMVNTWLDIIKIFKLNDLCS